MAELIDMSHFRPSLWRALIAAGLAAAAFATVTSATAANNDIDGLRSEAQAVADQVSALEHRIEHLDRSKDELSTRIDAIGAEMSSLDLDIRDASEAYDEARRTFVARAVAAYEAGASGSQLALLLSARDGNQMLLLAEANDRATRSN
ncbi:MAG: hypothetical protein M3290_06835, partial [Actinomycetota bacterium]|nr:hypothetical protein [Actinomycetota bacterium]